MSREHPVERPQTAAGGRERAEKGHGAKTAAARERAILALLSERTIGLAAAHVGVGERTLRRWLTEDAAFRAEYEAVRRTTFEAAMSRVATLTVAAVEALEDLVADTKHPTVRLGAARTVVEMAMHQHDGEAILHRLEAIERAQEQQRRQ
jgi:membrane protein required for beta-lactamase induction